jgi:type I restriction enzyme S subunit
LTKWREGELGEVAVINPAVPLRKGEAYPYVAMEDLEPFYRPVESRQQRIYTGGGSKFENGDVLFARITPCLENGKTAQVKNLPGGRGFGSTEFLVLRGREGVTDSRFLYYLLTEKSLRARAQQLMVGTSGRQRVDREQFAQLIVRVPELEVQKKIAALLGMLDEKIEQNRKLSRDLEQFAHLMYVRDFGTETRVRRLTDFVEVIGGGTPRTGRTEYWGGTIPWISVRDLRDVVIVETQKSITALGLENSAARWLPTFTTVLSARGTVGNVSLLGRPMTMNQSCYALRSPDGLDVFVYVSLKRSIGMLLQRAHGCVFDTITRETLDALWLPFEPGAARRYESRMRPLFELILSQAVENQRLKKTRNELLPLLLSGELDVSGAVASVQESLCFSGKREGMEVGA